MNNDDKGDFPLDNIERKNIHFDPWVSIDTNMSMLEIGGSNYEFSSWNGGRIDG